MSIPDNEEAPNRILLCRSCTAPIDIIWDVYYVNAARNKFYCSHCSHGREDITMVANNVAIDINNMRNETGSFSFVQKYSMAPPENAVPGCSFICIDCSKQHKILTRLLALCDRTNKEHRVIMAYDHSIKFDRGRFVEALEYSPIMN